MTKLKMVLALSLFTSCGKGSFTNITNKVKESRVSDSVKNLAEAIKNRVTLKVEEANRRVDEAIQEVADKINAKAVEVSSNK